MASKAGQRGGSQDLSCQVERRHLPRHPVGDGRDQAVHQETGDNCQSLSEKRSSNSFILAADGNTLSNLHLRRELWERHNPLLRPHHLLPALPRQLALRSPRSLALGWLHSGIWPLQSPYGQVAE